MRKGAIVLTVLAAITFLLGTFRCFGYRSFLWRVIPPWNPETWLNGSTGLLLFAIVLIMIDYTRRK